jgi:hypothetical protein
MKQWHKHAIVFLLGVLCALWIQHTYAAERCVKDSNGGICCWDTDSEGTLKPISCA